jgi:hypothetical protein
MRMQQLALCTEVQLPLIQKEPETAFATVNL